MFDVKEFELIEVHCWTSLQLDDWQGSCSVSLHDVEVRRILARIGSQIVQCYASAMCYALCI